MKVKKESINMCCWSGKSGFPTFALILLVLGALWILNDIGIMTVKVPWFPVVLVIIALGWIVDYYKKR